MPALLCACSLPLIVPMLGFFLPSDLQKNRSPKKMLRVSASQATTADEGIALPLAPILFISTCIKFFVILISLHVDVHVHAFNNEQKYRVTMLLNS